MRTAVVILNWNTKDYLRRFLPPLLASCEGQDAVVVVADNASTDGSVEMLQDEFPETVIVALDNNFGFTGGYNRALQVVDAEYYVLINSDIEVPKGWLKPLLDWMESHPRCGICGPKLLSYQNRDTFEYAGAAGGYLDRYGYPFCRGRLFGRVEKDHGQYDTPEDLFWVSGACLMVRSSLWKDLGGLDERFFVHMEEIDFCWRAQLAGYSVSSVPQSFVYHIGGGTLPQTSPRKLEFNYRNNLLMLENNLAASFKATDTRRRKDGFYQRKAGRRLLVRMLLDGLSALVYLFTGRRAAFQAVLRAHRGFRQLRRKKDIDGQNPAQIRGWYRGWIIPKSLLCK